MGDWIFLLLFFLLRWSFKDRGMTGMCPASVCLARGLCTTGSQPKETANLPDSCTMCCMSLCSCVWWAEGEWQCKAHHEVPAFFLSAKDIVLLMESRHTIMICCHFSFHPWNIYIYTWAKLAKWLQNLFLTNNRHSW